jgi:peptidoglycan hydrolase-like protein with peptidoglycan-binding domain
MTFGRGRDGHFLSGTPVGLPRLASPGPYDGEKTQAALAQFQIANLLPASGALDDQTLRALGVQRPSPAPEASAPADGENAAAGATEPAEAR